MVKRMMHIAQNLSLGGPGWVCSTFLTFAPKSQVHLIHVSFLMHTMRRSTKCPQPDPVLSPSVPQSVLFRRCRRSPLFGSVTLPNPPPPPPTTVGPRRWRRPVVVTRAPSVSVCRPEAADGGRGCRCVICWWPERCRCRPSSTGTLAAGPSCISCSAGIVSSPPCSATCRRWRTRASAETARGTRMSVGDGWNWHAPDIWRLTSDDDTCPQQSVLTWSTVALLVHAKMDTLTLAPAAYSRTLLHEWYQASPAADASQSETRLLL